MDSLHGVTAGARQILAHTHLVRGGFVMFEPTRSAVRLSWLISRPRGREIETVHPTVGYNITDPTSHEVGMRGTWRARLRIVGCNITDPPLTRWVCAKT